MKAMAAAAAGRATAPALGWFRLPRRRRSLKRLRGRAGRRQPSDLEPTIYRFILKHSWQPQLIALVLTLASFPFLYFSLDLPKTIINHAIRADAKFPQSVFGFEFDRVPYLMLLCGAFLVIVLINGALQILHQHLQGPARRADAAALPLPAVSAAAALSAAHFHKTSSAQIIPMITAECESLGGFIGDALALPAFQGGTLLTIIFFMFMQDPVLGAAAVALYPVQGYMIPKLQRKVNQLGKQRVRTAADRRRPGPGIGGRHRRNPHQRHGQAAADRFRQPARAHLRHPLRDLQAQVLRQVPQQLHRTADAVFLLLDRRLSGDPRQSVVRRAGRGAGGLQGHGLAVEGTARFLPAERGFADQVRADRRAVPARRADRSRAAAGRARARCRGSRASWRSAICRWPRTTAAAFSTRSASACGSTSMSRSSGQSGSGKNELALLLARLMRPTGGRITIGGHDLGELPLAVIGRRIGYVGATPYLFAGTLRDNLLLGLRHRPVRPAEYRRGRGAPARAPSSRRRAAPATSISICTPTGSITKPPGSRTPRNCRPASSRC